LIKPTIDATARSNQRLDQRDRSINPTARSTQRPDQRLVCVELVAVRVKAEGQFLQSPNPTLAGREITGVRVDELAAGGEGDDLIKATTCPSREATIIKRHKIFAGNAKILFHRFQPFVVLVKIPL
jgi:hypothetical protein